MSLPNRFEALEVIIPLIEAEELAKLDLSVSIMEPRQPNPERAHILGFLALHYAEPLGVWYLDGDEDHKDPVPPHHMSYDKLVEAFGFTDAEADVLFRLRENANKAEALEALRGAVRHKAVFVTTWPFHGFPWQSGEILLIRIVLACVCAAVTVPILFGLHAFGLPERVISATVLMALYASVATLSKGLGQANHKTCNRDFLRHLVIFGAIIILALSGLHIIMGAF